MANTEVITHGGTSRSYRVCRCARCGVKRRCTPDFDFYTFSNQAEGLLYCLDCLKPAADEAGYKGEPPHRGGDAVGNVCEELLCVDPRYLKEAPRGQAS
jgi:hypothetical protein